MPWDDEQEKLTLEARLFVASPDVVFEELKKRAEKLRTQRWWALHDEFETTLVERNERLINLGLAMYGTNRDVFKALYKHSLEPPSDGADAHYKRGLRVGCLSNTTLEAAHIAFDFPSEVVGKDETLRLLREANDDEIKALMLNPSIGDWVLEALYKRTDVFAQMPPERWCRLVSLSGGNDRLVTPVEYTDGPDLGHMHIHDAIFNLLEIAPVQIVWVRTLYELLDQLDYQQVETPKKIDHVLARWAALDDRDTDGKPYEGYFTALSLKDEFRCLVAAMYGRGFVDKGFIVHGRPDAEDVAARAAYYGKGDITAKEMKAGYERDDAAFTFAVLFNDRVYHNPELRKLLEERYVGGDMSRRYLKYDEQRRKRWPRYPAPLSETLRAEAAEAKPGKEFDPAHLAKIENRVDGLASQIAELKRIVIWVSIALAAVILFRYKF